MLHWTSFRSCNLFGTQLCLFSVPHQDVGLLVDKYTCRTPRFLMHSRCTACSLVCVQSYHAHAWLNIGVHLCVPGDIPAEQPPPARYEPNRIVEDQENKHFTGDGQFTEHEGLRVRPLFFHQSIIASTHDSAESIATPLEADFGDEQLRALLASPLYLQE